MKKLLSAVLVISSVLLALFVLVHGTQLLRWLNRKDYISFGAFNGGISKKKKQIHPTEITMANPHTQSPKLNIRRTNVPPSIKMNSAFSISGKTSR